jgi:hypothetical protein
MRRRQAAQTKNQRGSLYMKRALVIGGAAVILFALGVAGFSTPAAHASGDRKEDKLNHDSKDQKQDRLNGGDSSESSDSSSSSNDGSSSDVNSSATAKKAATVGGHWSGGINDGSLGAGTLDLVIAQSGKKLNGGFDTSFSSAAEDRAGSLKGKANSSGLSVKLRPNSGGQCRVVLTGTLSGAGELKGNYTSSKCNNVTSGSFDLLLEHS